MSEPTRTDNRPATCSTEHAELARDLVAFTKAAFVYPANHSRVVESRNSFLARLTALVQRTGESFALEIRADGIYAQDGKVPAFAVEQWFRDNLQKALLGAIRCDAAMTAEGLQAFGAKLRSICSGKVDKTATFASLWRKASFPGIDLAELRFFGGYHELELGGSRGTDSLRATMSTTSAELEAVLLRLGVDDQMLRRMRSIEDQLAAATAYDADGTPLSLPRELLAALPADVVADPAARPQFVGRLLDEFEALLQQPEASDRGILRNDAVDLVSLFRTVAQTFFGSRVLPTDEVKGPLPAPPARPEDRKDDLEDPLQLVPLVLALPETALRLEPEPGVLQAEVLNICLRQLGRHTEEHIVTPVIAKVKQILAEARPQAVQVLDQYVQKVLDPAANLLPEAVAANVLQRLGEHDLLASVRRQGTMAPERVIRHFPNGFLAFVDSLTQGGIGDAELLTRVLLGIEEAALASGTAQLLQQGGVLQPARLRKLLHLGGRSALGVARHLLQKDNRAAQEEVLQLLRRLGSRRPEAAPLQFIELDRLPPWYLQLLCDLERTGKFDARLRDHAGLLLRSYVESLAGAPQQLANKAEAIQALQAFPGRATEVLLYRLLRGRGFLGFLRVPRAVRKAARAVLERWREGAHV